MREGAAEVNATYSQVQAVVDDTERAVSYAVQSALELQNRSRELIYRASINDQRSAGNEQVREQCVTYSLWHYCILLVGL